MELKDNLIGLEHVGVPTKDLAKTIAFYESLGFTRIGMIPGGFCNKDDVYEDMYIYYHPTV